MIAIDVDGTLLGAEGKVSARNKAALQAANEAGIGHALRPWLEFGVPARIIAASPCAPRFAPCRRLTAPSTRIPDTALPRTT